MVHHSDLRLEPITADNWRTTLSVRTTPSQLEFVADYEPVALVILSKCFVRPGDIDWFPFAITINKKTVGVVALASSRNRCEILHLVIDRDQQGKGLGTASVHLLVDYIRKSWAEVETVSLTVHPDNQVAQHIYSACGFVATGELKDSQQVMEMPL